MRICQTCGVESAPPYPDVCPICADERQWVPASGQAWTTLADLKSSGARVTIAALDDGVWGLTAPIGIGQTSLVIDCGGAHVLWDPLGFLDDDAVAFLRSLGRTSAVVASHPHMYGVQTEWAAALDAPLVVSARDAHWLQRSSDAVRVVDGDVELEPGLWLHRLGGHFAGSLVLEWQGGAGGRGLLASSDTIMVNPDRATCSFMRSYPNRIPLSPAVTLRIAEAVGAMRVDRCVNNFGTAIASGAQDTIRRSAERQAAWCRGEFDDDC